MIPIFLKTSEHNLNRSKSGGYTLNELTFLHRDLFARSDETCVAVQMVELQLAVTGKSFNQLAGEAVCGLGPVQRVLF